MKEPIKISPVARRKQEAYAVEFERRWRLRAVKLPGFLEEMGEDLTFKDTGTFKEAVKIREEVAKEMEDWDVQL